VVALPTGTALLQYQQEAKEGRQNLVVYNWEMANPVPPNTVQLAIFSYTVLAADNAAAQPTVELLNEEIRNATFK
ncbi:MAG: hypothetical protein IT368_17860, partial [Candidatus Hydrogenedentes bacterium]|nr:hypothetical protein [Candidatus Hydrogenedentota bacterium]